MTSKKKPPKPKQKTSGKTKVRRKVASSPTSAFEKMLRKTAERERYELKLYVTGTSPRSGQAIANVRSLCEEYLSGRYDLEVIDIYQQPAIAASEQIIAAPTLIKKTPAPTRRMIGDLSNRDKILIALNLVASSPKTTWVKV
ncbi:MAG TPA: circadian clock KaiB family protein [Opitutaceae bacterium]|nr:circadian clock KaiB family protein [Opitutaceae bacterium]